MPSLERVACVGTERTHSTAYYATDFLLRETTEVTVAESRLRAELVSLERMGTERTHCSHIVTTAYGQSSNKIHIIAPLRPAVPSILVRRNDLSNMA